MKEIQVVLTDFEIEPKEIRVPAHETIRLLLINFGSMDHQFAVEGEQCGFEVQELKPGQTKALEHVFTNPGSFKTACYYGQQQDRGLSGWLVVEA